MIVCSPTEVSGSNNPIARLSVGSTGYINSFQLIVFHYFGSAFRLSSTSSLAAAESNLQPSKKKL